MDMLSDCLPLSSRPRPALSATSPRPARKRRRQQHDDNNDRKVNNEQQHKEHNAKVDGSILNACPALALPAEGALQHAVGPSSCGHCTMRCADCKCIRPRPRTSPKPPSAAQGRMSHSNTRSSLVTKRADLCGLRWPSGTATPTAKRCFSPLMRMPWTLMRKHAPAVYPPAPPRRHIESNAAASSPAFAGA